MKTQYLLGLSIVCLFVSAAFFAMARMETASIERLRYTIENVSLESENARIGMLVASSFGEDNNYCVAVNQRISSQISKNFSIMSQISATKDETFLQDITLLKKRYFLSNAELYYYLKQSNLVCGKDNVLILYFYIDATPCADCYLQGKILDSLRQKCKNLKVFAFPVDIDVETTNFFKEMFKIESVPAIIIDDKTVLTGLQSERQILQNLKCVSK